MTLYNTLARMTVTQQQIRQANIDYHNGKSMADVCVPHKLPQNLMRDLWEEMGLKSIRFKPAENGKYFKKYGRESVKKVIKMMERGINLQDACAEIGVVPWHMRKAITNYAESAGEEILIIEKPKNNKKATTRRRKTSDKDPLEIRVEQARRYLLLGFSVAKTAKKVHISQPEINKLKRKMIVNSELRATR